MRKLLLLVVAAAAVLAAVPASATPPSSVSDTFTVVAFTTTDIRTANGNTFITGTRTAVISGTFTGTATDTVTLVRCAIGVYAEYLMHLARRVRPDLERA